MNENNEFTVKCENAFGDPYSFSRLDVDLSNMATQYSIYLENKPGENDVIDEWPEFGYTLKHSYRSWVPFFHLYSSVMIEEKENKLTLIYTGRMKDGKDLVFFKLKDIPKAQQSVKLKLKSEGDKKVVKSGIFQIELDANWNEAGFEHKYVRSYWITKISRRDAALSIELIPREYVDDDMESLAAKVFCSSTLVIVSSVKLESKGNTIKVEYTVIDPSTLNETYMYDIFTADSNGNVHGFHLSTYLDVYTGNKKYFENLKKSLVISEK